MHFKHNQINFIYIKAHVTLLSTAFYCVLSREMHFLFRKENWLKPQHQQVFVAEMICYVTDTVTHGVLTECGGFCIFLQGDVTCFSEYMELWIHSARREELGAWLSETLQIKGDLQQTHKI